MAARSASAALFESASVDEPCVPGHGAVPAAARNRGGDTEFSGSSTLQRLAGCSCGALTNDTVTDGAPDRVGTVASVCQSAFGEGAGIGSDRGTAARSSAAGQR